MSDKESSSRRGFLKFLTSLVTGTTVLSVTTPNLKAETAKENPEKQETIPKAKGYQRTEHVDTYYDLADL